jgi:hypothetical protein
MSLDSSGRLHGTPTAHGSHGFTVRVTDSAGVTSTKAMSLEIQPAPLTIISPASLPDAILGAGYDQSFIATGGVGPFVWSLASGSLPAGVAFSTHGQLAGTSVETGTFMLSIRVVDALGSVSSIDRVLESVLPPPAIVEISSEDQSVGEGIGQIEIRVRRLGTIFGPVTVAYSFEPMGASAGLDYAGLPGTLAWADQDGADKVVSVTIIDDDEVESGESFAFRIGDVTGNAVFGSRIAASVQIVDNDLASPGAFQLSTGIYQANEGDGQVMIAVERSSPGNVPATVRIRTVEITARVGEDFDGVNEVLHFEAGELRKEVPLRILPDAIHEGDEVLRLDLEDPTGGAVLGPVPSAVLVIGDDDAAPGLGIGSASVVESDAGITTVALPVTLSSAAGVSVTVNYSAVGGGASAPGDFLPLSGTLTFSSGTVLQTINVSVVGDTVSETMESFVVELTNPVHAVIAEGRGEVEILDNDLAPPIRVDDESPSMGVVQFSAAAYELNEGGGAIRMDVERVGGSASTIRVTMEMAGGAAVLGQDFTITPEVLEWPEGDATTRSITLTALGDDLAEGVETVELRLRATDGNGGAVGANPVRVSIFDRVVDAWRFAQFGDRANDPLIGGDNQDPDGDGIPNLVEYALHLDPLTGSSNGLPAGGLIESDGEKFLTLRFTRLPSAVNLRYVVESSDDLIDWIPGASYTATQETGVSGETEEVGRSGSDVQQIVVRDRLPATANIRRFLRLRISRE